MAKDPEKLIRQLSLISYLMAERRPVTATEIRRDVEGYSDMTEDAFARRFYADRAELDSLGIHLSIGVNERVDARPGTLYDTLLVIGPEGVVLRHRKLVPTMQERVFFPLGMEHTEIGTAFTGSARGHVKGKPVEPAPVPEALLPALGASSTVRDVSQVLRSAFSGKQAPLAAPRASRNSGTPDSNGSKKTAK